MDNEENEINNANNLEEKQPKKSMTDYLHRANELRHDYQNAGGLTGMAKNAINNKINDKYNAVKDKAKDKIHNKTDELKKNAKDKIDSKIPESVKKKQEAIKAKGQNIKDKLNAPKNKINEAKGKLDDVKANLNEKIFRKGVKTAVDAVAPGAGVAAEKMLDVGEGNKAIEAARAASNPVSAVKEGTKKLLEVVVTKEVKKKIVVTLIPPLVVIFICVIIVLSLISKYTDSQSYAKGGPYSENSGGTSAVDKKYKAFYENVEKYSVKYYADRGMIIALLTSYKDNDIYTDEEDYTDDEDLVCTDEEIEDGSCIEETVDNVTTYSKSKMKRYIKKVAKKLQDYGNVVDEAEYKDKDYKDRNTGSDFFWWLYDEFIDDYYGEYIDNSNNATQKKAEIIRFVYLYYEDIKDSFSNYYAISSSCPNGITIDGAETHDLEEYVAGVVTAENSYSKNGNIESMKAQAVAARSFALAMTDDCTKPIENSSNAQNYKTPTDLAKKAASETSGQILVYNGKTVLAQYDHFNGTCTNGTCAGTYTKVPSNKTHEVSVPESYLNEFRNLGGHGMGMSQVAANYMQDQGKKYDEILKYFYADDISIATISAALVGDLYKFGGTTGVVSESLFPISKNDISKTYISAGDVYPDGTAHNALDIACSAGDSSCHKIGIYASHDGIVTSLGREQCNGYSAQAASKTGLSYKSNCGGTYVNVRVTSGKYRGYTFGYYHLSSLEQNIQVGSIISAGQLLGTMGNTGYSTGPHLHFQIKDTNGNPISIEKAGRAIYSNQAEG